MAKFVQHIIAYGDTIQSISQHRLGDMSRWVELAQFNNLRYPYIVDTVEEKMENPEHLKTVGDTLLVKVADDEQTNLIQELKRTSEFDQEEIYALALGKDLNILPLPKGMGDPGYDSEIFEMKGNSKGGIATVRGIENLRQSLFLRIITPKGGYVGHPNYGSDIHMYLGMKNTEENAALIDLELERTIRTDQRVTSCKLVNRVISGNSYTAAFSVSSLTLDEAFELVLTTQSNGPIVLLDNFNDFIN